MTKTDFDAKLSSLNKRVTANKTKHLLVENKLKKLKIFDFSYFIGKNHFGEDRTQNYLLFQPLHKCFKVITNTIMFHHENLKGCLKKTLQLLLRAIINSTQN